ncbi:MAG: hypothetical protein H7327_10345 [Herminiimonas sp.]|nr:hypothetical protein [Herminiimonas sp.]
MYLLIFLVPLQGVAGSIRSSCGPDHQMASVFTETLGHDGGGDVVQHDAGRHVHAAVADGDQTSDHHDHSHQHKSAFCGTCGSCCTGAFAPPSKIDWALRAAMISIDILSPVPFATGYIPDGLERPPRIFPA